MNQEELHERRMKGEKVLECVYEIANGKEEIRKYEKRIDAVWEMALKLLDSDIFYHLITLVSGECNRVVPMHMNIIFS